MELLKQLVAIHAPSGNESALTRFILQYVTSNQHTWKVQPEVIAGHRIQDCIILVFGTPRAAVYAHMDSIGFTVRYGNELVKIGGPVTEDGTILVGKDSGGEIEGILRVSEDGDLSVDFHREIDRGTELVFKSIWRETPATITSCYLDNRLGVWNALRLAETLENGMLIFSCWEEHGGGSVGYLAEIMYKQYGVQKALISDITWVTPGVPHGQGVVISLRDRGIPRKVFINEILRLARESHIPFQLEVEGAGSSDGGYLQASPYPVDWVFIGAAESHVHSPDETVHKADITSMLEMYQYLLKHLH